MPAFGAFWAFPKARLNGCSPPKRLLARERDRHQQGFPRPCATHPTPVCSRGGLHPQSSAIVRRRPGLRMGRKMGMTRCYSRILLECLVDFA